MKQVKAYVISNKRIMPGGPHRAGQALASRLIHLHCPEIAGKFQPGQFVMVRCGYETVLPRPFSVHQATKGSIVLFFAVLEGGKGSQWLSRRYKGKTAEIFGPLGKGFTIQPGVKNLLLVAGGMGLAPLCFLAQQAITEKRSVTFLLGTATGPLYTERPENLLPPGINIATATEDGSSGYHGKVTDLIPEYIDWADQIFACGPLPMYRDIARRKQELKGKPVQISLEVRMGCGVGACYGCTVRTKSGLRKVCKDGPVFDMEDVLWDELADI
jgi:dihydroorotate dehydrogenase electron transfer subunit